MASHSHSHQNAVIRTYLGLLLLTVCVFALMYCPQPMLYTLSQEFGVSKSNSALLVSVFMFFLVISPMCVGILLDRIGVRKALLVSTFLVGISGAGIYFAPNFLVLVGVRSFEALFVPVLVTSIMVSIASMFRHMDFNRALAGYVSCTLVGSLSGRILGGWCGELFGWRLTLTGVCVLFLLALVLIYNVPDTSGGHHTVHNPRVYGKILRQKGIPSLLFAEAAGLFVFSAMGNLVPFRMAELGQGHSEGLIGLMYVGYSVGILAGLIRGPLLRVFKKPSNIILFGSAFYMLACVTLAVPNLWVLFGGLWGVAFGEFSGLAYGGAEVVGKTDIVTRDISKEIDPEQGVWNIDGYDRSMGNGLFLSCYYSGGLVGSYVPGLIYTQFGWMACFGVLEGVLVLSFLIVLKLHHDIPGIR